MPESLIKAAQDTGLWLSARNWSLATAESCTGGLVSAAITEIAGSSAWFDRGFVTYTNAAKHELLGVRSATLLQFGAVSEQTAEEMALGALAHSKANIALSITGIAGPSGGTPNKPVGMVCFAWALREPQPDQAPVRACTHLLVGDRASVRTQAVLIALAGIADRVDLGAQD